MASFESWILNWGLNGRISLLFLIFATPRSLPHDLVESIPLATAIDIQKSLGVERAVLAGWRRERASSRWSSVYGGFMVVGPWGSSAVKATFCGAHHAKLWAKGKHVWQNYGTPKQMPNMSCLTSYLYSFWCSQARLVLSETCWMTVLLALFRLKLSESFLKPHIRLSNSATLLGFSVLGWAYLARSSSCWLHYKTEDPKKSHPKT